jgi:O-antigen/teichoic acid export membrane protein
VSTRTPDSVRRAVGGLAFPGLLRSSAWVLVGALVARGATLTAGIVVARIIAPSDFGKVTVMLAAILLLSGIAGLGLGLAITRQVAEVRIAEPGLAARYIGTALTLTAVGGLAVAAVLVAAQSVLADALLQDAHQGELVVASAGAVLFGALTVAIQGALTGLESFRPFAVAQCVQGLATGVGLVAGASAGDAAGALTGFSIGQAVAAGASLLILQRAARGHGAAPAYRIWPRETRQLFRYGLPTFGSFLAVSTALLGGQLILSRQADGYEQVALFSIAYRWHLALLFIPACVGPVLVPMIARLRAEAKAGEVASIFRASMWGTVLLAGAPAVVVAAVAPLLMGLSGGFYQDHPIPLVILAAVAVPAALNNILSSTSVGVGAMRAWLLSDVVLAAVVLTAAALLVAGLQADGLAIAYLAGYAATDLVLLRPVLRRLGQQGAPVGP